MPRVSVLFPLALVDEHRERAWRHVEHHYATNHAGWQQVIGVDETDGPWSKGEAVRDALRRSDSDIVVIADADSMVAPGALQMAVNALEDVAWAVPHLRVRRLTLPATEALYEGQEPTTGDDELARPLYIGFAGGGITVTSRVVLEDVPIDPRFTVWGGEDQAFGWALETLAGKPWRGTADLWHLWHPHPAPGKRNTHRRDLLNRYSVARNKPYLMEPLIKEARAELWLKLSQSSAPEAGPTTTATRPPAPR